MKSLLVLRYSLAALLVVGISQTVFAADIFSVVVKRVLDGDTVEISNMKQHVRLASIDAPEGSHGYGKPGQPFSQASTQHLEHLLARGPVTMACYDEDRYSRPVCELFVSGVSANKQMVIDGMAWANTSARGRYLRDRSLLVAQSQAAAAKKGIWSQSAIEPWNWRSDCWKNKVCIIEN